MQPTPGTQINPRVRLVRPLGEGSMGAIWLAEHTTLGTEVAVKFIAKELAEEDDIHERFQREARAAAQIKSPNVVQILDHGFTDEGVPYIVMELLEGQTLAHALEDGPLSLDQTVLVVTQVCRALAKAHVVGIIHRDIKPENIFLLDEQDKTGMEDQLVKVLDFGIAKHVEIPEHLTVPGMVIGTPGFMGPDQILDSKDANPATDLWSLAVVAYYCLTKELPFYGDTMAKLVGRHVKGEFAPVSDFRGDVPPELDDFFARAFARDPKDRFATAVDMATSFRAAAGRASGRLEIFSPASLKALNALAETNRPSVIASVTKDSQPPALERGKHTGIAVAAASLVAGVLIVLGVRAFSTSAADTPSEEPTASATISAAPPPSGPVNGPWLDIPAGSFRMGCDDVRETDCKSDTLPAREVTLRAFRINRREVTVAQYAHCADDEACTVEGLTSDPVQCTWNARRDNEQPLNCVSYEQAAAYCKWAGGALPTEAQWERVARGSDERRFPWGSEIPECSHAVLRDTQGPGCGRNKPWPGESRPRGVSPFGAQDMAGNLREWVADWFSPRPTNESEDPTGPKSGTQRVVRGGGWQSEGASLSAYRREAADPEMRSIDLGFRCARRVEAP